MQIGSINNVSTEGVASWLFLLQFSTNPHPYSTTAGDVGVKLAIVQHKYCEERKKNWNHIKESSLWAAW